jgi:hypothetical protein
LVAVVTGCSVPEAAVLGQRLLVCRRESQILRNATGKLDTQATELRRQLEARKIPDINPEDGHAKQLEEDVIYYKLKSHALANQLGGVLTERDALTAEVATLSESLRTQTELKQAQWAKYVPVESWPPRMDKNTLTVAVASAGLGLLLAYMLMSSSTRSPAEPFSPTSLRALRPNRSERY